MSVERRRTGDRISGGRFSDALCNWRAPGSQRVGFIVIFDEMKLCVVEMHNRRGAGWRGRFGKRIFVIVRAAAFALSRRASRRHAGQAASALVLHRYMQRVGIGRRRRAKNGVSDGLLLTIHGRSDRSNPRWNRRAVVDAGLGIFTKRRVIEDHRRKAANISMRRRRRGVVDFPR